MEILVWVAKKYDPPGFEPLFKRIVGTKGIAFRDHMGCKTRPLTEVAIERELAEAMADKFVHGAFWGGCMRRVLQKR